MIQHLPSTSSEELCDHPGAQGGKALLLVHLDAAYNLARWLMRNDAEADDVVQDAYLRAISRFAGFRGVYERVWLLTIVRNSCYDHLRQKRASGRNTDFDKAVHSGSRQSPNQETTMLPSQRTELLTNLLAELPAQYREVLVLRELEELSYREIANIIGIPVGTVMSRLSRARQHIPDSLFAMPAPETL
jgi:RNA polymerase sigma-70 factor (ECF subfamily)